MSDTMSDTTRDDVLRRAQAICDDHNDWLELGSPNDSLSTDNDGVTMFSEADNGTWVRAWIWVPYDEEPEDA